MLDAEGQLLGAFPKQHPVPLFLDGTPGTRRPLFRLPQGTLGVAICCDFDAPEVASWLVRHGATLLVDPSFDATSWGRVQHLHHELLLRLRAVENDRWILRAASSGRSEAVDHRGYPSREGVGLDESATAVVRYGHRATLPPGAYASFLGPAAGLATLLALLFFVARGIRARIRARREAAARVPDASFPDEREPEPRQRG